MSVLAAVRVRNQRRTSKTWNRYSYPLTPVLRCGKCGGKMHGEASSSKSKAHPIRFYYGCFNRRRWSSRDPGSVRCHAKWLRADELEEALREDLRRCLPTGELNAAYRERLGAAVKKSRTPAKVTRVALKKLEERLNRVKQMYEWGHIETEEYMAKQGEINEDRGRIRELATARPKQPMTSAGASSRSSTCCRPGTTPTQPNGLAWSTACTSASRSRWTPLVQRESLQCHTPTGRPSSAKSS